MTKITTEQAIKTLEEILDELGYDFMVEVVGAEVGTDGEGHVMVKFDFYDYEDKPQFITF